MKKQKSTRLLSAMVLSAMLNTLFLAGCTDDVSDCEIPEDSALTGESDNVGVDTSTESGIATDSVISTDSVSDSVSVSDSDSVTETEIPVTPETPQVENLLAQMTLDEKVGQMLQVERRETPSWLSEDGLDVELNPMDMQTYFIGSVLSGGGSVPGNNTVADWQALVTKLQDSALQTRLHIPMLYGVDAVHGHSNVYGATIMPHNIGLGATRDPDLVRRVSQVTAAEVAATSIPWTFSPCVAVSRDERWGRSYESVGEEPEIAILLSQASVQGFQGATMNGQNVIATAKHYVGDGGTLFGTGSYDPSQGGDRMQFMDRGDTPAEDIRDIHLPGFVEAVKAGVGSVMISFTSVDGVSMHANSELIQGVLKRELGFDGFTISDWDGIKEIDLDGQETMTPDDLFKAQVIASVNAGVDMFMIPFKADWLRFLSIVKTAVTEGVIPMSRIDDAVRRILRIKFRAGLFDKPYGDPQFQSEAFLGTPEHRAVAREAVRKSLVLLRNKEGLPLTTTQNILVTGKNANNIGHQCGGWTLSWQGGSDLITTVNEDGSETTTRAKYTEGTTILEGIQNYMTSHAATDGTNGVVDFMSEFALALPNDTQHYNVAVAVLGETPYAEWFGDRYSEELVLDDEDLDVLDVLYEARDAGRVDKIVVVLVSGRALVVTDEVQNWDGFVSAWLPGSEGDGVADVLFDNEFDFQGKLPVTWPRRIDLIPVNDGDYQEALYTYGYGMTMMTE
ncbi:MAG: glycoside hydrolase family 3 protein [Deltaproteobacteria bacterium]|nr:glycoside hydrolase family 3 protein [Deltaproteobacteria bacterium]